jgi:hypothetical protein
MGINSFSCALCAANSFYLRAESSPRLSNWKQENKNLSDHFMCGGKASRCPENRDAGAVFVWLNFIPCAP